MKVLLVEESQTIRTILRKELEPANYEIVEATTGAAMLEKVEKENPDLILMNTDLPDGDGVEFLRRLRSDQREAQRIHKTPVFFVTSNSQAEERERARAAGADDYIVTPVAKGGIVDRVNRYLAGGGSLRGLSAIVAEDMETARALITTCLRREGIEVFEAKDGVEAFHIAQAQKGRIDLVLTDFMMPAMNGIELCKKLRRELGWTQIPIIFLSAISEKNKIAEMFDAGATDYLLKPFSWKELVARMRVHIQVRQLNRELASKVEELKKLNKLKDEFIAIASHDLRSPLTGIMGFADLLMMSETITPEDRELVSRILDASKFLKSLIDDILDLARIEADSVQLELKPLDLVRVAESTINTLRHMATPKNITLALVKNCRSSSAWIDGDESAVLRILNNLVSNAIKFTPQGGKVDVMVTEENHETIRLDVADTGIGIPEDKIGFLFQKFSKASRKGTAGEKSTGLGLAITRELVERHGGQIKVASTVGKGTTFTVLFPRSRKGSPPTLTTGSSS